MSIYINEEKRTFHLTAGGFSYVLYVDENKHLNNLYWGGKLPDGDFTYLMEGFWDGASFDLKTARLPHEVPTRGVGYYGMPAVGALTQNGDDVCVLTYDGYELYKGKKKLSGLPAVYTEDDTEADTLVITLSDKLTGLTVKLSYSVLNSFGALTRSMELVNGGEETLTLTHILSASVPLYGNDYDVIYLNGGWARERAVMRESVGYATTRIESQRGASSHENNPFLAVCEKNADEDKGGVWGMTLVYSGSFVGLTEVNQMANTRLSMGLNPEVCRWMLAKGESFQTPEAILVYSDNGLNGMSHIYHDIIRRRIVRGVWRDKVRPILINNWEATYFGFNEESILKIAKKAAECGIELFVLDDGWFGKRDNDNCSLGDWIVNKKKLPCGIDGLAKQINAMGLMFGLWFEPEMVSPDSDLYRAHPDWCLHVDGRARTEARQQLILDMSRAEVQDYVIEALSDVLGTANVGYVKWDMNRNMTEYFSAGREKEHQLETQHRYMLGLYRVMEELTNRFPEVLFEGCSGGGGRFDAGMLQYMPQIWTSDDTDPVERTRIQYGTSFVYPPSSMGAHVSASPNHQTSRVTSITTRAHVALSGNFGFELDLNKLTDEEIAELKTVIDMVKRTRSTLQSGVFTRLESPFESDFVAWQFVSPEKDSALLFMMKRNARPNTEPHRIFMRDLIEEADYEDCETGRAYKGGMLMKAGILAPHGYGDFVTKVMEFRKK